MTPDEAAAPTPPATTRASLVARFAGAAPPPSAPPSAPLTWGQRALWAAIQLRGREQSLMSLRRIVAVPRRGPSDVPGVLRAIGTLVGRNSSLRTRIQPVDGEPRQVVAAAGELPVLLVEAGPDEQVEPGEAGVEARSIVADETMARSLAVADAEAGARSLAVADAEAGARSLAVAGAVADELAATPFDHAREWPQRVALVRVGTRVRHIVVVFSHTTVDFRAAELVLRELRLLLSRGELRTPPGAQSVDVAGWERDVYRRRSTRAAAYWVRGFARLPGRTLPWLAPAATPRFQRTVLVSEAASAAVRLTAQRHRVTTSTVLLAAVAAVVSRWSGTELCGLHSMAANRAAEGYATAVAKLNQLGLVLVDTADRPDFGDLLARVWQAAIEAYRHSYYDPVEVRHAFEAAGLPYGAGLPHETGVSPHCYVNDLRLDVDADLPGGPVDLPGGPVGAGLPAGALDEARVRDAMARTSVTPAGGLDRFAWRLRVEFLDQPRGVGIALTGDTGHLPAPAAERFLRDIEWLLVEAAFRDLPWPWLPSTPDATEDRSRSEG